MKPQLRKKIKDIKLDVPVKSGVTLHRLKQMNPFSLLWKIPPIVAFAIALFIVLLLFKSSGAASFNAVVVTDTNVETTSAVGPEDIAEIWPLLQISLKTPKAGTYVPARKLVAGVGFEPTTFRL